MTGAGTFKNCPTEHSLLYFFIAKNNECQVQMRYDLVVKRQRPVLIFFARNKQIEVAQKKFVCVERCTATGLYPAETILPISQPLAAGFFVSLTTAMGCKIRANAGSHHCEP